MKLICAIIKPSKLDDVCDALSDIGINGVTITEVKGFGKERGQIDLYRGVEYAHDFIPKVKLEIAITDDRANQVVMTIRQAAHTGKIGDGKIFIVQLEYIERIRTAETGEKALS